MFSYSWVFLLRATLGWLHSITVEARLLSTGLAKALSPMSSFRTDFLQEPLRIMVPVFYAASGVHFGPNTTPKGPPTPRSDRATMP